MQSGLWNPARRGKAIVGRPKGTYTNIFGQQRTTSGVFEGQKIEGKRVFKGKRRQNDGVTTEDYYIYPLPPSRAIQIAEEMLFKQWIPLAYKRTAQRVNFAKYLIESK